MPTVQMNDPETVPSKEERSILNEGVSRVWTSVVLESCQAFVLSELQTRPYP